MGSKWAACSLGDLVELNTAQYSRKDQWSVIKYLDTGSVKRGNIESSQTFKVGADEIPSRARRKVKHHSILYSMVRPNQEHYAILIHPDASMVASTGFAVIDVIQEIADPYYIYYYLTQGPITKHFQALAEQSVSTYPTLSAEDLLSLPIALPEISQQRRMATLLSSFDSKIRLNNRINDYLAA